MIVSAEGPLLVFVFVFFLMPHSWKLLQISEGWGEKKSKVLLQDRAPLSEVQEVGHGAGQMGHQLHSDPPVWLLGRVAGVRTLGPDGVGDVFQNGRDVLLPAAAVRAHQSRVLLEASLPVILFHVRGRLLPQPGGGAGHNITCQDSGCGDEVSRLDDGDFDPPGLHLVAEAVGEGFHAVFRDAIRRSHDVPHPSVHAGHVHHATCADTHAHTHTHAM